MIVLLMIHYDRECAPQPFLPERIRDYHASHVLVVGEDPSELAPMEEVERRYIARVMQAVGGNKTLAAKVLGFDRKTLYNKLEKRDGDKS